MGDPDQVYEEHDAQIIVLRDADTGEMRAEPANDDTRTRARSAAQERKAVFEHRTKGAQARAGKLPRALIAAYAAGATNLMLEKLLQEELVPGSAKEAADIAKITNTIYREASGQAAGNKNLTPPERAAKMAEVETLETALAERAKAAGEQLSGAVPAGEPVPEVEPDEPINQWEHDEH